MSRRKLAEESNKDEELIPEIPARWSIRRIVIALTILLVIVFSIYYYFSLKNFQEQPNKVLGVSRKESQNKPEIMLPSKESVNTIIKDAKDSLSKIDANNVISSQPEIQKIIQDLQNLTKKDVNAKNMVCDLVCKK